ncbi:MAG: hypothetical protein JST47_01460 [Bacteroidetes bacterium]|nr:hypothetical protein [Bacteroidota bacterium]MBS1975299.1 hypothetical protein [Bacteroidota bacterium]
MNPKKLILAGIAGGIVIFLLGYLTYGMLLMDFFDKHAGAVKNTGRNPNQMLFLYLILGNIIYGFLLAYIFGKAKIASIGNGLVTGAIIGFLSTSATDSVSYATTFVHSRTSVAADVITFTILSAAAGVVVAWIAGPGRKA